MSAETGSVSLSQEEENILSYFEEYGVWSNLNDIINLIMRERPEDPEFFLLAQLRAWDATEQMIGKPYAPGDGYHLESVNSRAPSPLSNDNSVQESEKRNFSKPEGTAAAAATTTPHKADLDADRRLSIGSGMGDESYTDILSKDKDDLAVVNAFEPQATDSLFNPQTQIVERLMEQQRRVEEDAKRKELNEAQAVIEAEEKLKREALAARATARQELKKISESAVYESASAVLGTLTTLTSQPHFALLQHIISLGLATDKTHLSADVQQFYAAQERSLATTPITHLFRIMYEGPLHPGIDILALGRPSIVGAAARIHPLQVANVCFHAAYRVVCGAGSGELSSNSLMTLFSGGIARHTLASAAAGGEDSDAKLSPTAIPVAGRMQSLMQFRLMVRLCHTWLTTMCYPAPKWNRLLASALYRLVGYEGFYITPCMIRALSAALLEEVKGDLQQALGDAEDEVAYCSAAFKVSLVSLVADSVSLLEGLATPASKSSSAGSDKADVQLADVLAQCASIPAGTTSTAVVLDALAGITEAQVREELLLQRGDLLGYSTLSTLLPVVGSLRSAPCAELADHFALHGFTNRDDLASLLAVMLRCTRNIPRTRFVVSRSSSRQLSHSSSGETSQNGSPIVLEGSQRNFGDSEKTRKAEHDSTTPQCLRQASATDLNDASLAELKYRATLVTAFVEVISEFQAVALERVLHDRVIREEDLYCPTLPGVMNKAMQPATPQSPSLLDVLMHRFSHCTREDVQKIVDTLVAIMEGTIDLPFAFFCLSSCALFITHYAQLCQEVCAFIQATEPRSTVLIFARWCTALTDYVLRRMPVALTANTRDPFDQQVAQMILTSSATNPDTGLFTDAIRNPITRTNLQNTESFLHFHCWNYTRIGNSSNDPNVWRREVLSKVEVLGQQGVTSAECAKLCSISLVHAKEVESSIRSGPHGTGGHVSSGVSGRGDLQVLGGSNCSNVLLASAACASIMAVMLEQLRSTECPSFVLSETQSRWQRIGEAKRIEIIDSALATYSTLSSANSLDSRDTLSQRMAEYFSGCISLRDMSEFVVALLACGVLPCHIHVFISKVQSHIDYEQHNNAPPYFLFLMRRTIIFMLTDLDRKVVAYAKQHVPIMDAWEEFLRDPGCVFDCVKAVLKLVPPESVQGHDVNELRERLRVKPNKYVRPFSMRVPDEERMEFAVWLALHRELPKGFLENVTLTYIGLFLFASDTYVPNDTSEHDILLLIQSIDCTYRKLLGHMEPRMADLERARNLLVAHTGITWLPPAWTYTFNGQGACSEKEEEVIEEPVPGAGVLLTYPLFSPKRENLADIAAWRRSTIFVNTMQVFSAECQVCEGWFANIVVEYLRDLLVVLTVAKAPTAIMSFRELFARLLIRGATAASLRLVLRRFSMALHRLRIPFDEAFPQLLEVVLSVHLEAELDDELVMVDMHNTVSAMLPSAIGGAEAGRVFMQFCYARGVRLHISAMHLHRRHFLHLLANGNQVQPSSSASNVYGSSSNPHNTTASAYSSGGFSHGNERGPLSGGKLSSNTRGPWQNFVQGGGGNGNTDELSREMVEEYIYSNILYLLFRLSSAHTSAKDVKSSIAANSIVLHKDLQAIFALQALFIMSAGSSSLGMDLIGYYGEFMLVKVQENQQRMKMRQGNNTSTVTPALSVSKVTADVVFAWSRVMEGVVKTVYPIITDFYVPHRPLSEEPLRALPQDFRSLDLVACFKQLNEVEAALLPRTMTTHGAAREENSSETTANTSSSHSLSYCHNNSSSGYVVMKRSMPKNGCVYDCGTIVEYYTRLCEVLYKYIVQDEKRRSTSATCKLLSTILEGTSTDLMVACMLLLNGVQEIEEIDSLWVRRGNNNSNVSGHSRQRQSSESQSGAKPFLLLNPSNISSPMWSMKSPTIGDTTTSKTQSVHSSQTGSTRKRFASSYTHLFISLTHKLIAGYDERVRGCFERVIQHHASTADTLLKVAASVTNTMAFENRLPFTAEVVLSPQLKILTATLLRSLSMCIQTTHLAEVPKSAGEKIAAVHQAPPTSLAWLQNTGTGALFGDMAGETGAAAAGGGGGGVSSGGASTGLRRLHAAQRTIRSARTVFFDSYAPIFFSPEVWEMIHCVVIVPRDLVALSRLLAPAAAAAAATVAPALGSEASTELSSVAIPNSAPASVRQLDGESSSMKRPLQSRSFVTSAISNSSRQQQPQKVSNAYIEIVELDQLWRNYLRLLATLLRTHMSITSELHVTDFQKAALYHAVQRLSPMMYLDHLKVCPSGAPYIHPWQFPLVLKATGLSDVPGLDVKQQQQQDLSMSVSQIIVLDALHHNCSAFARSLIHAIKVHGGPHGMETAQTFARIMYRRLLWQRTTVLSQTMCITAEEADALTNAWSAAFPEKFFSRNERDGSEQRADDQKQEQPQVSLETLLDYIGPSSPQEHDAIVCALGLLDHIIRTQLRALFVWYSTPSVLCAVLVQLPYKGRQVLHQALTTRWAPIAQTICVMFTNSGALEAHLHLLLRVLRATRVSLDLAARLYDRRTFSTHMRALPYDKIAKFLMDPQLLHNLAAMEHPVAIQRSLEELLKTTLETVHALYKVTSNPSLSEDVSIREALFTMMCWVDSHDQTVANIDGGGNPISFQAGVFMLNGLLSADLEEVEMVMDEDLYGGIGNSSADDQLRVFFCYALLLSQNYREMFPAGAAIPHLASLPHRDVTSAPVRVPLLYTDSVDTSPRGNAGVQFFSSRGLIDSCVAAVTERVLRAVKKGMSGGRRGTKIGSRSTGVAHYGHGGGAGASERSVSPAMSGCSHGAPVTRDSALRQLLEVLFEYIVAALGTGSDDLTTVFLAFHARVWDSIRVIQQQQRMEDGITISYLEVCRLVFIFAQELQNRSKKQFPEESTAVTDRILPSLCRSLYGECWAVEERVAATSMAHKSVLGNSTGGRMQNNMLSGSLLDSSGRGTRFSSQLRREKDASQVSERGAPLFLTNSSPTSQRAQEPYQRLLGAGGGLPFLPVAARQDSNRGSDEDAASLRSTDQLKVPAVARTVGVMAPVPPLGPPPPLMGDGRGDNASDAEVSMTKNDEATAALLAAAEVSTRDLQDRQVAAGLRNGLPHSDLRIFASVWFRILPELHPFLLFVMPRYVSTHMERVLAEPDISLLSRFFLLLHRLAFRCMSEDWMTTDALAEIVREWLIEHNYYKEEEEEGEVVDTHQVRQLCLSAASAIVAALAQSRAEDPGGAYFQERIVRDAWIRSLAYVIDAIANCFSPPEDPNESVSYVSKNSRVRQLSSHSLLERVMVSGNSAPHDGATGAARNDEAEGGSHLREDPSGQDASSPNGTIDTYRTTPIGAKEGTGSDDEDGEEEDEKDDYETRSVTTLREGDIPIRKGSRGKGRNTIKRRNSSPFSPLSTVADGEFSGTAKGIGSSQQEHSMTNPSGSKSALGSFAQGLDENSPFQSEKNQFGNNAAQGREAGIITMEEVVAAHTPDRTWTVINNVVYDITKFSREHPGGLDTILSYCAGQDGTEKFFEVHGGDQMALHRLAYMRIGVLGEWS